MTLNFTTIVTAVTIAMQQPFLVYNGQILMIPSNKHYNVALETKIQHSHVTRNNNHKHNHSPTNFHYLRPRNAH